VHGLRRHRLTLTREQRKAYDDSVRDDDNKGREQSFPSEEAEVEGLADEPCPDCGGARLNPTARGVTFEDQAISESRAVGARGTAVGGRRCSCTGATPTSRATWSVEIRAGWSSWKTWAWAT
jgi:excinuclease ABC subunit A